MKIVICSSMRNKNLIHELLQAYESSEIEVFFPNLNFDLKKEDFKSQTMVKLQNDHFNKMKSADIIYVLNPDKYIGQMVSIEIGYAKALGKRIIFTTRTGNLELDVLADDFLSIAELLLLKL